MGLWERTTANRAWELTQTGPGATIRYVRMVPSMPASRTVVVAFLLMVTAVGGIAVSQTLAQAQKPDLPDPVKYVNKFDVVWNVVKAALDEMGFSIELEDKKAGRLVTKPYEFISGALTSSEVDKVAVKKDTITGNWLKARYSVEALLEIISPTETLVTIRTKMEALNRDLDGTEKWVPVESLGTYERRILGKISMKLLGNDTEFNNKKGFWNKRPQPVDQRPSRIPSRPPG
jgi:hypothetical protein